MKIKMISLGCSKNLVDSEKLLGLLIENNQEIINEADKADAIIINTCGFIEPAKKEAIDTILEMAEYKKNNLKYLIVMGCLSQRYKEELEKELWEVDRFISIDEYNNIGSILSGIFKEEIKNNYGRTTRALSGKPWMAYLKISEGCNNNCAFCAIPKIRGKYVSEKMEDLILEANKLASSGVKELNIVAQDTTRYGLDLYKKKMLLPLLIELDKIEGLKWIRVLYMYPEAMDDDLIKGMANLKKVVPYFDIPVQYGNDKILKLMNRKGMVMDIENVVNKIRSTFDDPILRTTLIVGFPNETEETFNDTLEMVKKMKWDRLGAFMYSKEENTLAYDFDNQVDEEVKRDRLDRLMKVQDEISTSKNEAYVGKRLEVLVEGIHPLTNSYYGRSKYQGPDGIDGEVIISSDEKIEIGTFINVIINKAKNHRLIASYRRE